MDANKELIEALNQIEREKDISKEVLLEALENSRCCMQEQFWQG